MNEKPKEYLLRSLNSSTDEIETSFKEAIRTIKRDCIRDATKGI